MLSPVWPLYRHIRVTKEIATKKLEKTTCPRREVGVTRAEGSNSSEELEYRKPHRTKVRITGIQQICQNRGKV